MNQYFTLSEMWKMRGVFLPLLFSPGKIFNYLRLSRDLALKRTDISGKPCIIMVEPSSYCDMVCPMCPVTLNQTQRPRAILPLEVFEKLIAEIGNELILITFWNFGEPLLNENIFKMVKLAKTKKIFCALSSNLLSLTPERAEAMIDSGLDYLIVSFDGASRETYEKFRGKGNYERVVKNLGHLIRKKNELRARRPFINLQFIVMRDNEHEIGAIKEFSRRIGVDKLSLKKFTYVSEETRSFLPRNSDYILGKYKTSKRMKFCSRVWNSAVLCADGAIVPCCGDLNFEYKFGDLNDPATGFMDIWNSESYRNLRKAILEDINAIPMCRNCPSTDYTADMFI